MQLLTHKPTAKVNDCRKSVQHLVALNDVSLYKIEIMRMVSDFGTFRKILLLNAITGYK